MYKNRRVAFFLFQLFVFTGFPEAAKAAAGDTLTSVRVLTDKSTNFSDELIVNTMHHAFTSFVYAPSSPQYCFRDHGPASKVYSEGCLYNTARI